MLVFSVNLFEEEAKENWKTSSKSVYSKKISTKCSDEATKQKLNQVETTFKTTI